MENILKSQPVPNSNYIVVDGGEFQEEELVVCCDKDNEEITVAYQAYYINHGIVYSEREE